MPKHANLKNNGFCGRLPNTATKAELMAAHRAKMADKSGPSRDADYSHGSMIAQLNRGLKPKSNLSRNHPDARLSIAGHFENKTLRRAAAFLRQTPGWSR